MQLKKFSSVKSIQAQVNYTEWMTAHFYLGSGVWRHADSGNVLLDDTGCSRLKSQLKAVGLHFWLRAIGVLLCVLPGYAAGVVRRLHERHG